MDKQLAKRKVASVTRRDNRLDCVLECGHVVPRRVKKRRPRFNGESREDPPPKWVYCDECKEGA